MNYLPYHRVVLIALTVLMGLSANAQNAYYDALKIDFLKSKAKVFQIDYKNDSIKLIALIKVSSSLIVQPKTSYAKILESYKNNYSTAYNNNKVAIQKLRINLNSLKAGLSEIPDSANYDMFINNPFNQKLSKEDLEKIRESVVIDKFGELALSPQFTTAMGLQSGINPSNLISIPTSAQSAIIDGTAKFLAERFKEDITTLYLDKFRKKLDDVEELRALYPKTYSFLKTADVFNYRSLGNDFKEAFEEDLKNTLSNLGIYINDNSTLKDKLIDSKVYYPFDFALSLSDKLVKGHPPVEILDFLEHRYKDSPENGFKNYYNIVHGLNILQNNLQRKKPDDSNNQSIVLQKQFENIWLKFSDLRKLDSPKKVEYFMALIYNEDPDYFTNVLKINANNASDFFKNTIYPTAELLNTIENIQSKEKSMTADDYVDVMTNSLNLLKLINSKVEETNELTNISFINANGTTVNVEVLEFIDKVIDLYKSIQTKDYGYIVTNSLYITEKVLLASGKSEVNTLKVTLALSKYGGFMVDVVTADNSDDVKEAIKKNITKFSFLDKRNSLFSITISAHPGVYGGFEELEENKKWKANFGITAPIGFEFMWGIRGKADSNKKQYIFVKEKDSMKVKTETIKYRSGSAFSIFASFVDIGAAFNYRLNDSESELPQELTFKQIFSPGISLNYGFRNSPITLGAGIQYTPELRNVTVDNIEINSNSLRAMLRLSWDIPLAKIYSKN